VSDIWCYLCATLNVKFNVLKYIMIYASEVGFIQ